MKDLGPLGEIINLAYALAALLAVLWFAGVFWIVMQAMLPLWPLLGLLLAVAASIFYLSHIRKGG